MSKFAIFQTGGKQYRVQAGDIVKVEKLDAADTVEFDQVLMIDDKIGTPFIDGAKVIATVVEQKRADKVLVFKKKRRQHTRKQVRRPLMDATRPDADWALKNPVAAVLSQVISLFVSVAHLCTQA